MCCPTFTAGIARNGCWTCAAWRYSGVPAGRPTALPLLRERFPRAVAAGAAVPVPGPQVDFSASELRRLLATGRSTRYRIPEPVAAYIAEHGLYRNEHQTTGIDCAPTGGCHRSNATGVMPQE